MFNAVLAYITALAVLTGAGSVPAVPETAVKTTVDNIVISCGDESVALDYSLEWMRAAGSSEAALGYDFIRDGETLLDMDAKFTAEEMLFSLTEDGGVYSISDDFAMEFFAMEEGDLAPLTEAAAVIEGLEEVVRVGGHILFADELFNAISAHEAAETIETEDALTEAVSLHFENGADFAFVDTLRTGDTEYLSRFVQWVLDISGLMDDTEYASFIELYDGSDSYDTYTMHRLAPNGVPMRYTLRICSKGEEGELIVDMIFQPNYFSFISQPQGASAGTEEPLNFECRREGGRITEATFSYGYTETEESVYGSEDEYTDIYTEKVSVDYRFSRENGLAGHEFRVHTLLENENTEHGEQFYSDSAETIIACTANERIDENGGAVTGVKADMDHRFSYSGLTPTEISLQAAFDVRSEEIPYADVFAGKEITPIVNEDEIPPRLKGDVMSMGSRAALLIYDDQLNEVIAMIERSMEEVEVPAGPVLPDKESAAVQKDAMEDKLKAKEEKSRPGGKAGQDASADQSLDMKYQNKKKDASFVAVPEPVIPDTVFN